MPLNDRRRTSRQGPMAREIGSAQALIPVIAGSACAGPDRDAHTRRFDGPSPPAPRVASLRSLHLKLANDIARQGGVRTPAESVRADEVEELALRGIPRRI